ncbi:MAG: ATP synthase epsilon chain [Candidatus Tectimicrobiota bacterium]|nr:MAG: ATP synthase epsilon chain [Candidatus Tectomicrobia bacterium]
MPLEVEIITPNRVLLHEVVDELNVPGALGYLGILPGHTALLTTLGQGVLMYRKGQERRYLSLFWGYMEVNNDKVTILAELAEPAEEIDRARAEAARQRAEERLRRFEDATIDRERARAALERALIRLQVAARAAAPSPH